MHISLGIFFTFTIRMQKTLFPIGREKSAISQWPRGHIVKRFAMWLADKSYPLVQQSGIGASNPAPGANSCLVCRLLVVFIIFSFKNNFQLKTAHYVRQLPTKKAQFKFFLPPEGSRLLLTSPWGLKKYTFYKNIMRNSEIWNTLL